MNRKSEFPLPNPNSVHADSVLPRRRTFEIRSSWLRFLQPVRGNQWISSCPKRSISMMN